jgi:hypothetical protein
MMTERWRVTEGWIDEHQGNKQIDAKNQVDDSETREQTPTFHSLSVMYSTNYFLSCFEPSEGPLTTLTVSK